MQFRILFCRILVLFQTQFGGVRDDVVLMKWGLMKCLMKWGANANEDEHQKRAAVTTTAVTTTAGTTTGTCSNLQCDHFRHKCDIEWKASKDR